MLRALCIPLATALFCWFLAVPARVSAQPADFVDDVVIVPPDTVFPPVPPPPPALTERCVVSVLNRTAKVQPDGTVILPNVPSTFGPVRARATCVVKGVTFTGQSELITVPAGGDVDIGPIRFDAPVPIPSSLGIAASLSTLTAPGATSQLTVTAVFPDTSTADVTASPATSYRSSNPAVAAVTAAGLVTAVSGGPVLISVLHEGASGFIRLTVDLNTVDSDGDGIPDGVETANGLDPNDALDGFADPDGDGLSNKEELVDFGTNPKLRDTDGDGLSDGEERTRGTNPLAVDTDGDGVRDGLEVQTGSDPLDTASVDLAAALSRIDVAPAPFVLTVNTLLGEAAVQLAVTGQLRDGTTIDLTAPARGTGYASSDLTVCSFETPAGRVMAAGDGACTITVSSNGFTAVTAGRVQTFAPRALSFVAIPGFANNVDVSGHFAYVASGATGLQVVDVSNPSAPQVVAALDTAGNGNDVKVVGTTVYLADGAAGLSVIDVSNPLAPVLRGTATMPGVAQDVAVKGTIAYVAAGTSGLQVVDVADPAAPIVIGAVDTPGTAKGVDVVADQPLVVVADGPGGIRVIDVANPAAPAIIGAVAIGTSSDARDVVVQGSFAFVADYYRSFTTIDLATPTAPVVRASLPPASGGFLTDVVAVGRFALGAAFTNLVPIVDVGTPASPVVRASLDFTPFRVENATGIAADPSFVYLTTGGPIENGVSGNSRLYVGQYLAPTDGARLPPAVQIVAPAAGATVIEGAVLPIRVTATDDVAVLGVDILATGSLVRTLTEPPYQYALTVPTGVGSLTLDARAIDFGNNVSVASVTVNVIADPHTTATGRTLGGASAPIAGATVTCLGITGTSAADGTFVIPNVPSIRGHVTCTATVADGQGQTLTGAVTGGAPVRGGTTAVGNLVLALRGSLAFGPPQEFSAFGLPFRLKVGDFNGDGILDVVAPVVASNLNPAPAYLSLHLGTGDGTFQNRQRIPVGSFPVDVAVADLDADGKLDLVSANALSDDVSVLLGQGDGTFLPQRRFMAGSFPYGVAVGDVDGGGVPDLVVVNQNAATVSVLLGNGDGTFAPQVTFPTVGTPNAVAVVDLDGDGADDVVVVGTESPDVAVLMSNGNGTLRPQQLFSMHPEPNDLVVGDLNRDGHADLVVTYRTSGNVSVRFGAGDGTFLAEQHYPFASNGPTQVLVADVNGDGFPDVLHNGGFNSFVVLLNSGDGTLLPRQSFPDPNPSRGTTLSLAVGDLNGDGRADVVRCSRSTQQIYVQLQQ